MEPVCDLVCFECATYGFVSLVTALPAHAQTGRRAGPGTRARVRVRRAFAGLVCVRSAAVRPVVRMEAVFAGLVACSGVRHPALSGCRMRLIPVIGRCAPAEAAPGSDGPGVVCWRCGLLACRVDRRFPVAGCFLPGARGWGHRVTCKRGFRSGPIAASGPDPGSPGWGHRSL